MSPQILKQIEIETAKANLRHNLSRIKELENYQTKLKAFVKYLEDLNKNTKNAKKLADEHIKISGKGLCTDNLENIATSLCSISGTVFTYNFQIVKQIKKYEQLVDKNRTLIATLNSTGDSK